MKSIIACAVGAAVIVCSTSAASAVNAQAPNARLAGVIGFDIASSQVQIFRRKAISGVTHPGVGLFCIFPAASANLLLSQVVPFISAQDVQGRAAADVYWMALNPDCPGNSIEIKTTDIDIGTGGITNRDSVVFMILVP